MLFHLVALVVRERAARDAQEVELGGVEQRPFAVEVAVRHASSSASSDAARRRPTTTRGSFACLDGSPSSATQLARAARASSARLLDREQEAQADRVDASVGQLLRFAEDVFGNGDLAEIVQQRGVAHLAQRVRVEVQVREGAGLDRVGGLGLQRR